MKARIYGFWEKCSMLFLSILLLSAAVFCIARMTPGDPLVSYYGDRVERMNTQERERVERRLGLHEPMLTQYLQWADRAMHGDFGISYKYKIPAAEVMMSRMEHTMILGGGGFLLIFFGAILLGVFCAMQEDSLMDRGICRLGTTTSSLPEFWLALLLIMIFSVNFSLLPSSGAYAIGQEGNLANRLLHLILPMTVVVLNHLWYYAYMVRNKMLEELREDYVLLARIKGLSKARILFFHCLRNALPSYLSIMSIAVPHILGGTYIVEMVFSYPGIGTLAYESARFQDYNLLMLICIFSGALVMVSNLLAQFVNEQIDPRIKHDAAAEYLELKHE